MRTHFCARQNRWLAPVAALAIALLSAGAGRAQTLTTGAISGDVLDPTGAAVPNAQVSATNTGSGQVRTTNSGAAGHYSLSQLAPGNYTVKVTASGFRTEEQGPIAVATSQVVTLDLKLELGKTTEIVEISEEAPLISTLNPNTTTNINAQQIASLPNPGMDLSYVAQVAPGAVMNTAGGYGNVEYNGLPSVSNNFSIDGIDANDPFLNLNNSGATNLQLGLNAIQEVSVNTLSYSVDQGRLGAAQMNYVSKSGSNNFHGNVYEIWNGSHMNAANFFLNAPPGASCGPADNTKCKPFSNVNQFGGSGGGPILKNRLFFFADYEATRIALPTVQTATVPTQAFEQYTLSQIPLGGVDPLTNQTFAPPTNPQPVVAYYQNVFKLYGSPGGNPVRKKGCPFFTDGTFVPLQLGVPAPVGDGCRLRRTFGISNHTKDQLINARVDQNIGDSNRVWYKFIWERGIQATYTDPINPVFNAFSTQPQVTGAMGFTHIFSPTLVNEFNPGVYWYSALFQPNSLSKALAASPFELRGGGTFSNIFGAAGSWPQGRNVTLWQLIDNLTWTHGNHTLKLGENLRRTLVSDHDPGIGSIGRANPDNIVQWSLGIANSADINYPASLVEPIANVALDTYAMDTWKFRPNVTVTYGVRVTWNSDPVSQHNHFSRLINDFAGITHDVTVPLNQIIKAGNALMLPSVQLLVWQPRAAVAWEVKPNTIVRVGAGLFSDVFPSSLADSILGNFPNNNAFTAGINQPVSGIYVVPGSGNGVSGSSSNDVFTALGQANQALLAGFQSGAPSCAITNPPPNCMPLGNYQSVNNYLPYPYFTEWSAEIEHQFGNNFGLIAKYVGTNSRHIPYTYALNAYQTVCDGCFAPFLYSPNFTGIDPRFAAVTEQTQGATSQYHGLQVTAKQRLTHGLQYQVNYEWSHCVDEVSNGGFFFFDGQAALSAIPGQLYRNLGNCDYDHRHNLNASYVYTLRSPAKSRWLKPLVNGWQVSGDVFLRSGFPVTASSASYGLNGNGIFQGSGPTFAIPLSGQPLYIKTKGPFASAVSQPEIQWLNPAAFTSVVDSNTGACAAGETFDNLGNVTGFNDNPQTCTLGTAGRNTLFGPGFKFADIFVSKYFNITERVKFRLDFQFYNAFNHPNFNLPSNPNTGANTFGVPGNSATVATLYDVGTINSTVNPPTGLLGSFLGGDSSVRMIAISGRIEF